MHPLKSGDSASRIYGKKNSVYDVASESDVILASPKVNATSVKK